MENLKYSDKSNKTLTIPLHRHKHTVDKNVFQNIPQHDRTTHKTRTDPLRNLTTASTTPTSTNHRNSNQFPGKFAGKSVEVAIRPADLREAVNLANADRLCAIDFINVRILLWFVLVFVYLSVYLSGWVVYDAHSAKEVLR